MLNIITKYPQNTTSKICWLVGFHNNCKIKICSSIIGVIMMMWSLYLVEGGPSAMCICIWWEAGLVRCVFVFGWGRAWCSQPIILLPPPICTATQTSPLHYRWWIEPAQFLDEQQVKRQFKNPLLWHILLIELAHFEMQNCTVNLSLFHLLYQAHGTFHRNAHFHFFF